MALNIKAIRVKVTAKRAAAYMSALPYFNPLMQRPPTVSYLHHTAAYIILSTVQCGVRRRGVPPGARHAAVVNQGAQKEK